MTDSTLYRDALDRVPGCLRPSVEALKAQATAYVWGWQDAGGDEHGTQPSIDFGYAYGVVAADYASERRGSRPNIAAAWRKWRESGSID